MRTWENLLRIERGAPECFPYSLLYLDEVVPRDDTLWIKSTSRISRGPFGGQLDISDNFQRPIDFVALP